jgi:hypothetical protein
MHYKIYNYLSVGKLGELKMRSFFNGILHLDFLKQYFEYFQLVSSSKYTHIRELTLSFKYASLLNNYKMIFSLARVFAR